MPGNMLKGAIIGTGFWANYQVPAWQELEGVQIIAAYNRTVSKANAIAEKFGIPAVYDDVETMLDKEKPDFVDIITDVDTHAFVVAIVGKRRGNIDDRHSRKCRLCIFWFGNNGTRRDHETGDDKQQHQSPVQKFLFNKWVH